MIKSKIINFLENHSSPIKSKFIENFKFRKENKYWLKYSQWVAIIFIATLDDINMSVTEFADKANFKEEDAKNMLSGKYNFSLRELAKIETILNINLLMMK